MSAIKLALVRQRYSPFGGAERFLSRAAEALRVRGARITVVARQWTGGEPVLLCDPPYLGKLWRDWSFARCVCRALARQDFDLVQSHERIDCCDIYRAGDGVHREWLAQRARVLDPLKRLGLRLNPYHRYVLAAERRLFASARLKAVICNSNMVKEEIRRHFNVAEEKLHVIYSGVDTHDYHPGVREMHRRTMRERLGIPADAALFLFVGSGFERKGLSVALHATALLPKMVHMVVVGRDRHARRYHELAQRLGLGLRVHFAGPQSDVRPFYGAADAVVLPTLYDPFPNVALEAMACGLPFVTSPKSGAAELLREGENGFVCDALDVPALASKLERLLDPDAATRMGQQARQTVEPLSLEAMTRHLLALYESLVA